MGQLLSFAKEVERGRMFGGASDNTNPVWGRTGTSGQPCTGADGGAGQPTQGAWPLAAQGSPTQCSIFPLGHVVTLSRVFFTVLHDLEKKIKKKSHSLCLLALACLKRAATSCLLAHPGKI